MPKIPKKSDISPQASIARGFGSTLPGTSLQERISKIAFELYEKRGRQPGHELDDWLRAEKIAKRQM